MEIKNALIEKTMLGYEDHGIFTCFLSLKFDGGGQGFGGYRLDAPPKMLGTSFGIQFLGMILKTVGVESWEELKGKHIRIEADYSKIKRIGHFMENRWFDPSVDLEKYTKGIL